MMIEKLRLNDEISVFYAPFRVGERFCEKMLDEKDRVRLNDYPNLAHSLQFVASRALKFYVFNDFLNENSKSRAQKLNFCLSHSKNLVALALAPFKIGFDIEMIVQRNVNACLEFCFNDSEKARVLGQSGKNKARILGRSGENLDEFYRIFTAKEALLKLNDLQFSDFDKVGFDKDGKLISAKGQKIQILHHKFSFDEREFMVCCVFS